MSTATIPQALSLFNALSHAGKVDTITALYHGAPTFDVAGKSPQELDFIVAAWINSGAIPADALALACATTVAATQTLLAVAPPPVAPAPPVAPSHAFRVGDAVQRITGAATRGVITGLQGASGVHVQWDSHINPQEYAASDLMPYVAPQPVAPTIAPAQPVQTPLAAAIVTPVTPAFDAAAMPRQRSRVLARSLFPDVPQDVRDCIPAELAVEYYAHPEAPPVDPDYAFTGSILAACMGALAASPCFNLWFKGSRATGKTEMARQLAARTGRPFFRFNFNRSTTSEDILGGQAITKGDTHTQLGPVAVGASTEGAIVLLDEPTYTVAAHVASLNPVLERDGAKVRVPRTGEVLHIAAGVCFICADNTGGHGSTSNEYHGRTQFGSDTLDRLSIFLHFDYLPADVERRVLRALVKRACGIKPSSALARSVCKIVATCRAKADAGELEGAPSLRRAVAFCVSLVQGFPAADAYVNCVVNAAPDDSQEALRQIFAATWDHGVSLAQPAADANPFVSENSNAIPF